MPNRIIKESICYSDDIDRLTWFEEVVFYRLIVRCDDNGRLDARPPFLRSMLFATKHGVTEQDVSDAVGSLAAVGLVTLYEAGGRPFLMFPKWGLHQRIRNVRGKYPPPEDGGPPTAAADCGGARPESQSESESQSQSQTESQSESESGSHARARPPTEEEVSAYCAARGSTVDPGRFVDFYRAKGWKIGSEPMHDWKAAVRTWERRGAEGEKRPDGAANRRAREDMERMRAFLAKEKEAALKP